MPTIFDAVRFLASRCDGARALDHQGFNKFDADRLRGMAEKPYHRWSPRERRMVHSALLKYRSQLESGGLGNPSDLSLKTDVGLVHGRVEDRPGGQIMVLSCGAIGYTDVAGPAHTREALRDAAVKILRGHHWVGRLLVHYGDPTVARVQTVERRI